MAKKTKTVKAPKVPSAKAKTAKAPLAKLKSTPDPIRHRQSERVRQRATEYLKQQERPATKTPAKKSLVQKATEARKTKLAGKAAAKTAKKATYAAKIAKAGKIGKGLLRGKRVLGFAAKRVIPLYAAAEVGFFSGKKVVKAVKEGTAAVGAASERKALATASKKKYGSLERAAATRRARTGGR